MIKVVIKRTRRSSRMSGSTYHEKHINYECGAGRIQTRISRQLASVLSVEAYDPDRQFLWPTISLQDYGSYPHRLSGVSLAGPYEQISIVYVVWQIPLSFLLCKRVCSARLTSRLWSLDSTSIFGRLDLSQVCSLLLSCSHHVKELCCVPQGGLALSILPGHGRHCSCATAAALIARDREVDQTSECA